MADGGTLIKATDAAKMLGVTPRTIIRWVELGTIPGFKRAGVRSVLVPKAEIERLAVPERIKPKQIKRKRN